MQCSCRSVITWPPPPPPPQCNDVCRCRYIKPRKWFTCQLFSPPTHNRKQKQLNHEGYGEYPRLLLVSNMYQQIQCNGFLSRSSRLFVLYHEQCDAMRQKTLLWPQHGPPFLRSSAILKNCQHIFGRWCHDCLAASTAPPSPASSTDFVARISCHRATRHSHSQLLTVSRCRAWSLSPSPCAWSPWPRPSRCCCRRAPPRPSPRRAASCWPRPRAPSPPSPPPASSSASSPSPRSSPSSSFSRTSNSRGGQSASPVFYHQMTTKFRKWIKTLRTSTDHYYWVRPLARLRPGWWDWDTFLCISPLSSGHLDLDLVRGHNTLIHCIPVHWLVCAQHVASTWYNKHDILPGPGPSKAASHHPHIVPMCPGSGRHYSLQSTLHSCWSLFAL